MLFLPISVDVPEYCLSYPKNVIPSPSNCAEYFNCSEVSTEFDGKLECTYPDLFSVASRTCETFVDVNCTDRLEPMAPCKTLLLQYICFFYDQHIISLRPINKTNTTRPCYCEMLFRFIAD